MKEKNNEHAIKRIVGEIEKIGKKANKIMFYVLDTEGYASGSLAYEYQLAKIAKDAGYDVSMVYQSDEKDNGFVGVGGWLGEEYASLPHYDIRKDEIEINPSDILFIPEIFSQVMNQTKRLPCKRIAIMQNFDYILSQTPYSAQWGDYGIVDAIANTEENKKLLNGVFPYVKTTVIDPYIDKMFGETKQPKKCVVNIVAHNQDDVTRVVKPFYWKFPLMKWVSFADLRGMNKAKFSEFNNINMMHDKIATLVRGFITNNIPDSIYNGQEIVKNMYSEEKTKKQFIEYIENVLEERKKALEELKKIGDNKEKENNNGKEE